MSRLPVPIPSPMLNEIGLVSEPWKVFFNQKQPGIDVFWNGPPDGKPDPGQYPSGTLMYRVDWAVTYFALSSSTQSAWIYLTGTYRANLSQKPSGLLISDQGLLFYALDYDRLFRFDGLFWHRAPGEIPHMYCWFGATQFTGWGLCNGATYTQTNDDGTTSSVTPITLTDGRYVKGGLSAGGGGPIIFPTITGDTGSAGPGTDSSGSFELGYTSGGDTVNVVGGHSHTVDSHSHSAGSLVNSIDLEPLHATLLPYYRL